MTTSAETVDAVVIGAGPNGLVAANLLADAGWQVLVLEAGEEPGGAVRTGEHVAPGFRHDLFSSFYPLGAASPILRGLELDRYGLVWSYAPDVLAHVLPDDRCVVLSRELDRTAASVASFASTDGDAWRAEVHDWHRVRDRLLDALFTPFPPVRAATRLVRTLGAAGSLRLARMVTMPATTYGAERFTGDGARLLLAGNALHSDLGPGEAGSAVFGWLLSMLGQDEGFPVPRGGAGALTAALVRRLTERGGRVACGRSVTKVLVAGGQAMGVADQDGNLVRAGRAVLATVPAPVLYRDLVGERHLPSRFVTALKGFQWDDATIKVDWALSRPIPWRNPEASGAGTVHLGGDLAGLAEFGAALATDRLPDNPFLLLGQMSTADPTRSPAGTESAWAYTHVPHGRVRSRDDLLRIADHLQRIVGNHAPGFADTIIGRHVAGPVDLERQNPNLVGGAVNGGTSAIHQQLVFRPVPGLGRADTPIDRLYLAGASAHPGGAVHGGPGANAAKAALARDGLAGAGYAALIRTLHRNLYR
ncbi:phytoene desaturase family protein [Kibdelosporangium phytohabitans]|uniref:FAD-dependent oxidoreductase n=1 Tax=Kibdelosporangium phytohabitans TaxID=860235 RepID=A0A0N9HYH0_9PSEU|nr:NAD(P)/FAD-dependent oxidoreductase [Kibdelosporangium phytohabitans]ALG10490.1 FAD-dependent oxidoreductase [Kibdelosporangium phytohabitans]MBE1461580.1 phytoene dehydrogenase-like protein [Kibdelosporangium phytohabitans]